MGALVWLVDACLREALLFAGAGFLIGGFDDLVIDLMWLRRRIAARFARAPSIETLARAETPLRLAIFVPTWREDQVIGAMLRAALGRIRHADYSIYVGCYPNDPDTIAAVRIVEDPRVRLVIGADPGPTTKAGNLNAMWRALRADDVAASRATAAVILHDAEDVIDADELRIHDALLRSHAAVQTPVLPLIDPAHRLVSGHYADEFAEPIHALPQWRQATARLAMRRISSMWRWTVMSRPRVALGRGRSSIRSIRARRRGTASSRVASSWSAVSSPSIARRY